MIRVVKHEAKFDFVNIHFSYSHSLEASAVRERETGKSWQSENIKIKFSCWSKVSVYETASFFYINCKGAKILSPKNKPKHRVGLGLLGVLLGVYEYINLSFSYLIFSDLYRPIIFKITIK